MPDLEKHFDTHGNIPETLWYPRRGILLLVWDVEELFSMALPDQSQHVSIVVVSAMIAVRWFQVNAGTSVPTPKQLSNVKFNNSLDLFRTIWKVLRILRAIERMRARQRLMHWFRAVMTAWVYERAKRQMYRNTEAYQSFKLDIRPGAYTRAFVTHRNCAYSGKMSSWDFLHTMSGGKRGLTS